MKQIQTIKNYITIRKEMEQSGSIIIQQSRLNYRINYGLSERIFSFSVYLTGLDIDKLKLLVLHSINIAVEFSKTKKACFEWSFHNSRGFKH